MKKMIVAFAFVWTLVLASGAAAASYADLTEKSRFYDEIMFLTERGVATEWAPNRFGSEEGVTRETVAVMISRSLDLPLKGQAAFKDVPATSDASAHIEAARAKGILSGYPDGTFRPNEKVDRSQLALFLNRAFAYEGAAKGSFTDVGPNMKAYEHIQRLVAARITGGFPDGTYRPNEVVTRGQFAAFLARSLDDSFLGKVPAPAPKPVAPAPKPPVKPTPKPVAPAPKPTVKPKPKPSIPTGRPAGPNDIVPGAPIHFKNCTEMRKYYPQGVTKGHPSYKLKHDRDRDGYACER